MSQANNTGASDPNAPTPDPTSMVFTDSSREPTAYAFDDKGHRVLSLGTEHLKEIERRAAASAAGLHVGPWPVGGAQ